MLKLAKLQLVSVCDGVLKPSQTLTSCNSAAFGIFYQHLYQVCISFTSSNGEPFLLEKHWLESVVSNSSQNAHWKTPFMIPWLPKEQISLYTPMSFYVQASFNQASPYLKNSISFRLTCKTLSSVSGLHPL